MGNYIDEDQIKELNHHKLMMQKYIQENGDMKQDSDAFLIPDSVLKQMNANHIILNIPFSKVSMGIHEDIAWLHISKWKKTSIKIWNDGGWNKSINGYGMSFQYKFFTYGEGKIYFEGFKRKHPASIQDIVHSIKDSPVAKDIFRRWIHQEKKKRPFFNDLERYILSVLDKDTGAIPMDINAFYTFHSWGEYFKNHYKNKCELRFNYNIYSPTVSYAYQKLEKFVQDTDRQLLLSILTQKEESIFKHRNISRVKNYFFDFYFENKLGIESRSNDPFFLEDWIELCMREKIKISLRIQSIKKIKKLHDKIAIDKFIKKNKKTKDEVLITSQSKFDDLRKLLPSRFEWIKTKNRLYLEAVMMSHCVWSYAKKIKADRCAIYSYIYKDTGDRHTIEFTKKRNIYCINQMKRKYNLEFDQIVYDEVKQLLDGAKK